MLCSADLLLCFIFVAICSGYIHSLFIRLMSRVLANGPGDRGSISGRVIPKTQKMVLDAALLST